MFMENLPKKGPLFREFWAQKPTHMGGTYPYPQHGMLPPGSKPPLHPHFNISDERRSETRRLFENEVFPYLWSKFNFGLIEMSAKTKRKEG